VRSWWYGLTNAVVGGGLSIGFDPDTQRASRTPRTTLRERLDALGPGPPAELLHVLMLPDFERADRIGEFWSSQRLATSPSY